MINEVFGLGRSRAPLKCVFLNRNAGTLRFLGSFDFAKLPKGARPKKLKIFNKSIDKYWVLVYNKSILGTSYIYNIHASA